MRGTYNLHAAQKKVGRKRDQPRIAKENKERKRNKALFSDRDASTICETNVFIYKPVSFPIVK